MKAKILNFKDGIKFLDIRISKLINQYPAVIIGVAGGSASGKSTISKIIAKKFNGKVLSMDDYYVGIENMKVKNFDDPDAIDLNLFKDHIALLKNHEEIQKPVYNFINSHRVGYETYKPSKVVLAEGLFILNNIIKDMLNIKVFVDADENIRFERRVERDMKERHQIKEKVIKRWYKYVKPMHDLYVEPQKKYADIIIKN